MTTWIGSPNFTQGRQGNKASGVIIHWMDGNLNSADSVFQDRNRNTSAHYGVEDSNVHQYVKEEDTAYQAGNWDVNLRTIGIEHSAQPGRNASDATYESSAQLIAAAAKRWGFAVVGADIHPHSFVVATQCPGTVDVNRLINRANQLLGGSAPVGQPDAPSLPASSIGGTATVIVDDLFVRAAPSVHAPLAGSQKLHRDDTFSYSGLVQGDTYQGVSTWVKSSKGNYVWAGGLDVPTTPPVAIALGGTAETIRPVNVRVAPSTTAALGGSKSLEAGKTFGFSALVHGENVSQNGVTTDLWYHSNVGNYVWSGNCKTI